MIEQAEHIADMVVHLVWKTRNFGQAVSALVMKDHAPIIGKGGGDRIPDAEVGAERIDENQRRPVPCPAPRPVQRVMNIDAIDAGKSERRTGIHM